MNDPHADNPREEMEAGDQQDMPTDDVTAQEQDGEQSDEQLLADLQAQRDELENKLLRAAADYQNLARRSQLNVEAARQQQLLDVARALVGVMDHFDNALNVEPGKTDTASLLTGVRIVRDELTRTLEQFGIRRLDVQPGEEFDPNRHEALMRQEQQGINSNHVVTQLQPGYVLGDRTVRAAKVSVAP